MTVTATDPVQLAEPEGASPTELGASRGWALPAIRARRDNAPRESRLWSHLLRYKLP